MAIYQFGMYGNLLEFDSSKHARRLNIKLIAQRERASKTTQNNNVRNASIQINIHHFTSHILFRAKHFAFILTRRTRILDELISTPYKMLASLKHSKYIFFYGDIE